MEPKELEFAGWNSREEGDGGEKVAERVSYYPPCGKISEVCFKEERFNWTHGFSLLTVSSIVLGPGQADHHDKEHMSKDIHLMVAQT